MSLLSTLAKVAVGVAVAKGVSGMAAGKQRNTTTRSRPSGGAGTGSIFGDRLSPGAAPQSGGGLGDLLKGGGAGGLGDLLQGGGLGDLLKGGGLGDLLKNTGAGGLGEILSGRTGSGGGMGGMLDGLSKASRPGGGTVARPDSGSFGDLLNQSLDRFGEPDTPPTPEHEDTAKILLRAMLQAAKSDGRIDADEKKNLLGQMGDVSKEDNAFINEVLDGPVDAQALARQVPARMATQVYSMSLLAIDLDSKKEANYLHELAQALNIEPRDVNAIHGQMGEPNLYN